jgi:hypothetical protein
MIRPTKYTDLNLSLLNIASFMLQNVRDNKSLTYEELLNKMVDSLGERSRFNYISALIFLYSLGLVDYSSRSDAFYFDKKEESKNEIK